jgi:Cd2+/Zn2+-exporting ATPase
MSDKNDTRDDSCCSDDSCSSKKHPQFKKELNLLTESSSFSSKGGQESPSTPREPKFKKSLNLITVPSEPINACCENDTCSDPNNAELPEQKIITDDEMLEYRIQGMDCPACAVTIEKSIRKMEGITKVDVNYSTTKMQVVAADSSITDRIQTQVKKLGYEVEPIEKDKNNETFVIEGMDCSACAVSIEKHLKTLPSVREVTVNFATGKMQIAYETSVEDVIKEVKRAGYKASLVRQGRTIAAPHKTESISLTVFSGVLIVFGLLGSYMDASPFFINMLSAVALFITGYKPAKSAFYAIKSGSLDMNVLMTAAAIGAAIIGEWLEGATVLWLFAFGTMLQNKSIARTRDSIRNLMDLAPPEAWVKVYGNFRRQPVEDFSIGDIFVVKPGEKIALDGEITKGTSSINQAPITGESIPIDKGIGDAVYAGTVNESGSIQVKVTKLVEDTTIARIIHMVEEAQEKKAPTQSFVDRFATLYTPIVFALALIIMVLPPLFGWGTWGEWFYKGLELLVVACPCALVISTPVAIVSAIGNAARNGVLIKGGTALELAGALKVIAFDKTGTLTEGKPKVSEIIALEVTEAELLSVARTIEEHSKHPIAQAIVKFASERGAIQLQGADFKAILGKGAQATIDETEYFAGNLKLFENFKVPLVEIKGRVESLQTDGNSIVIIGTRTKVLGIIAVADSIRDVTAKSIEELKTVGIEQVVMLTGDNEGTAKKVSSKVPIDRYFAELLPEDKVSVIQTIKQEGKVVAMVGDGINDAPALASADVGIAMGGAGTDTAMETADIVLMADNLEKLPHTIKLSRKAIRIIKQNIWFSILVKLVALILIFPGWLTLWIAVISDTGAAILVILNSMRLLKMK